MSPRLVPLVVTLLALAAAVSIVAEADPLMRVPLVATVMLVLPGLGVWRLLRLQGSVASLLAVVVLGSLACDVVVAQGLLLAGHLAPLPLMTLLSGIGVAGSLRDLPGRRT